MLFIFRYPLVWAAMNRSKNPNILGDRRSRHRRRLHARVWIDPGGTAAPIDCLVVDRSDSGAKLVELNGQQLPPVFEISFERHVPPQPARVVWRYGEMIGVSFKPSDADETPR